MPYSVTGTDLVSTSTTGTLGNGDSTGVKFSADGTKIVFASKSNSSAAGWPAGDSGSHYDIFVKDLATGALTQITHDGDGDSLNASFSTDGTKVIFQSTASNLVAGDTNGVSDVFIYDIAGATTTRVSIDSLGAQIAGTSKDAYFFSSSNNSIVFTSNDSTLVANDTNGTNDIFMKDLNDGTIQRLSVNLLGQEANGEVSHLVSDGSKIAFLSTASNFTLTDSNGIQDLFVKSLSNGAVARVNTSSIAQQATDGLVSDFSFSPDGTKIVFASTTSNIGDIPDANGVSDIFVKNLITGQLDVVTKINNVIGNGASFKPMFSPDSTKVVFYSEATNFDPADTNGVADIYMKDLNTGEFLRISVDPLTGDNSNGASLNPIFSPVNNNKIAFESTATNFTAGDTNAHSDIFITTITNGNSAPVAVPDTTFEIENIESVNLYNVVLANDYDAESGVHITNVLTGATNGTVFFDKDNQILTYTPQGAAIDGLREGQTGIDTFEYVIQDDAGISRKTTVTVNIAGVNDDPVAVDDAESANVGVTTANLAPHILSNDTDLDIGDTKRILSVNTTGTHGTVNFNVTNQTLTYNASAAAYPTLGAGQTAIDTFTYTMKDAAGAISTATVSVTVTGINHAPTAVNDSINVNENATTGNIYNTVLANDTDPDSIDTKTIVSINDNNTALGDVTFDSSNHILTYSADTAAFDALKAGQQITESFTYTMRDTAGLTSTATVSVNVTGVNDAPVAVNDLVTLNAGTTTGNIAPTLLANDTDPDTGDTKVVTAVTAAGLGTATFNAGAVTYAANNPAFTALAAGESTTDSFTYTMKDGSNVASTATVNVTIHGVNDGPVSQDDASSINEGDTSVNLTPTLLSNDSDVDHNDVITVTAVDTTGTHGQVVFDSNTGEVTYTATQGAYAGLLPGQTTTDTFTYTITDKSGATSTSTVTMTITGVNTNDAPIANNDAVNVNEDATTANLVPTLLANDTDPDISFGDSLRVISVNDSGLTLGTLTFDEPSQTLTYAADADAADALAEGETATESFTYTIADEDGLTSTATATITVTGKNDGPIAHIDTVVATAGATTANLQPSLISNDTDVDHGAVLTIDSVDTGITTGTVNFNPTAQTLTYTANGASYAALAAGQTATDNFAYTVTDEHGATSTTSVTVNITGVNDGPTANDDAINTTENLQTSNLVPTLLQNDVDPDTGDVLSVVSVDDSGLNLGALAFDQSGQSLTYVANGPDADALAEGETVTESFTYTIKDTSGITSTATATVTLTGVNDGPDSEDDASAVNEGDTSVDLTSLLLSNDSDVDHGDTFNITGIDTTGTKGNVDFTGGVLTYTATAGAYAGLQPGQTTTDTFTYTITDSNGATSTSTVTMTITGVDFNDAPEANDDNLNAVENVATGNLVPLILANDTDADNDTLHVTSVDDSAITQGTLTFDETAQTLVYLSNNDSLAQGETKTETFTYTVEDPSGESSTATATITLTGTNDGPVANADSTGVAAGATTANLTSLVLSNDTDIDHGAVLNVASVDATGTQGSVNLSGSSLTYTADGAAFTALGAGQTATDTFKYTVSDEHGATSEATVTVTVTGANDGPTANDDAVAATENVTTGNLVPGLLSNDTDPDTGDTLRVQSVDGTGLTYGALVFDEPSQSLTYAANSSAAEALKQGETVTETFTYTIADASGATSTATATVTLTGANDAPVAGGDAATVNAGATTANLVSTLLSNDSDIDHDAALSVASVDTTGTSGTVDFNAGTQTLAYTANGAAYAALGVGQTATDSFAYTVTDEHGATSTATVTVTITGVNDGPTANDDAVAATENVTTGNLVPGLLSNDTDPDTGDTLRVTGVNDAGLTLGALTFNESAQSLTYLAGSAADSLGAGETTTETFTYTIKDAAGATSTATATVTLTGVNDGPVSGDDASAINEGDTSIDLTSLVLSNDSDIDHGDSFDITGIDTTGTKGQVDFTGGVLKYTATAGAYAGLLPGQTTTDTFTYTITDEHGATSTSTVTMTITGQNFNDAPIAQDDDLNAVENVATGNLIPLILANDTDADNDTLVVTAVDNSAITLGTLTFNQAGQTLVYHANNAAADALAEGETKTETFTYTIKDPSGETSSATATITVTGTNDGPVANLDTATVGAGASTGNIHASLISNDTDVDHGAVLNVASVDTTGTQGTVNFNAGAHTLSYTASDAAFTALGAGQTATDTFKYTVADEHGATSETSVTVTVTGANDGPTAVNDTASVNEDAITGNLAATLLANDTDPDSGDTKSITAVNAAGTTLGTVSFNAGTQTLTYAADKAAADSLKAGQTATDTFTYTMQDAAGTTSTATVTMTVTGVNDDPTAANDAVAVNVGATTANLTTVLLSNDTDLDVGDTKAIASVDTTGTQGLVTFNAGTQSLTYKAQGAAYASLGAGQTATDTFKYTMQDGSGATSTASVTVTVTGVNDGPTANNDAVGVNEDATTGNLTATLLANDTDPDAGDTKSIISVDGSGTALGTVSFNAGTQTLTYAADKAAADSLRAGQTATDTFTYTMKDAAGATSTATVTMTVTGINDNPLAVNDAFSIAKGATTANITGTLLSNDTDLDVGDTKAIASIDTTGTKGVLSFNAGTQSLTYKAQNAAFDSLGAGQSATDTFKYTMQDGSGATSTATVTVTVTGVNDGPTANNDAVSVNEDATTANLTATLLANDTDPDAGDTKSIVSVNAAGLVYGSVVFNASTQSLTYAANKNLADTLGVGESATETFTYTMKDGAGSTSTATVTMTINGVNDAPVAVNDAYHVTNSIVINVADLLADDKDIDGDTLAFNGVTVTTTKGTLINNGNGTLTYTANSGYSGKDKFTYSVSDGHGGFDTAVVNLTVKSSGKVINGTPKDNTLKGGSGNDTITGGADKGCVTLSHDSFFLGTKTSETLIAKDTDSNASTIGWSKAWGQYTPLFNITAVGIGETEATGYKYSTTIPSFDNNTGNAHANGIGTEGKANLGGSLNQEIGYDPRTQKSEKLIFDSKGELMSKAAFDLTAFFSKANGADNLGGTKYSEAGHWEAYKDGVLVGQGDFVAGVNDTNKADHATLSAVGSGNNESLLTLDFSTSGGFDRVILSAKQYDGLNANQSAAANKALGTTNAKDSSDFMVRSVKVDMLENTFHVTPGDHLYGGAGNDTFIFNKGAGVDVIHDFTTGDIIQTTYKLTDVVTGFGTDTIIFKNGTAGYEAIVADDNGHLWSATDFHFG